VIINAQDVESKGALEEVMAPLFSGVRFSEAGLLAPGVLDERKELLKLERGRETVNVKYD
jgi:hypothetical protein